MNFYTRLTVIAGFLLIFGTSVFAQSGHDIMQSVEDRNNPKSSHALVSLVLIDNKGEESKRVVEQWSADDPAGDTHTVIVFHAPASVKNTRFLQKENKNADDDRWIYLPALRKVRRIAASEGDSSFMGTEFTYDDMASREVEDYTYKVLPEEKALGYDCFVVEATPKNPEDSQYTRTISWIVKDPEIRVPVKIAMFDKNGTQIKEFNVQKLEKISGYWIPTSVTMNNLENGRKTNLIQEKIELDGPINTALFSPRFLETGKAR